MKVLIVAKTRQGKGACVGGITFDGQSVRLIAAGEDANEFAGMEYEVGDVWEVECRPAVDIIPPHVENIHVYQKRKFPPIDDPVAFIRRHMPPHEGGLDALYQGLTQATGQGALYIAERTGVPPFSTTFWIPDRPLQRDDDAKRIRYRYPTDDGGRTLTYVGFLDPVEVIEAGTLLRVSLAHWWRPTEMPDGELRCYVQLSGWFLPDEPHAWLAEQPAWDEPAIYSVPIPGLPARPVSTTDLDMDSAQELLETVFGYDEFRPLQEEIIKNLLGRNDTLAIMPTGSGKSLCYQLPALMFDGLTVVVSPLISLMQDQVTQLRELGIPAVFLNSTLAYEGYVQVTQQVKRGDVRLLYVAPETLLRPETLLLLDQSKLDCLTIDEAHCISQWGHDFRPVYRQLISVRQRLPGAVCIAVTATATPRVQKDIKESLGFLTSNEYVASFNRENLFLQVQPKADPFSQTVDFLDAHPNQSGIIYCATRSQVDALAAALAGQGRSVLPYHAGLDSETRRNYQTRFTHDDVQIIVATIAFGMGIDKPNVRFVVHYDLPKDLESYYQQIGRAGRDGLQADCLLLFGRGDVININRFIDEMSPEERVRATMRLQALVRFAETDICRRIPLLTYFGEAYNVENCGMCDNCLSDDIELVDVTIPAQKFLSCVKRTGQLFGVNHIVAVLRGSKSQQVLKWQHDRLSTYGIGQEYSTRQWKQLAGQFIQKGLLTQDIKHGSLKLTSKAYDVFRGEKVMGVLKTKRIRDVSRRHEPPEHDADLFELLRAKRKQLADAAGLPPYVIFSDRSLVEMAAYFPQSESAFAAIHGVGRVKLEKHADQFLPLICDYCQANQIEEKPRPARSRSRPSGSNRVRITARTHAIAAAHEGGRPVAAIATELGIKERTVLNHLWNYLRAGNELTPDRFLEQSALSEEGRNRVLAAFEEHGTDFLRPIYEDLNKSISYDDLQLLRLYHMCRAEAVQNESRVA